MAAGLKRDASSEDRALAETTTKSVERGNEPQ
jgi:hypothetical protein